MAVTLEQALLVRNRSAAIPGVKGTDDHRAVVEVVPVYFEQIEIDRSYSSVEAQVGPLEDRCQQQRRDNRSHYDDHCSTDRSQRHRSLPCLGRCTAGIVEQHPAH